MFELVLVSVDVALITTAVSAGVRAVLVDWERHGKADRQAGMDTQINEHTAEDLRRVREATDAQLICRLNRDAAAHPAEIEQAIARGADELLLPMVRTPADVEPVLRRAEGRCGVGIMLETLSAVQLAEAFAQLPLSRVYLGLNDLAIERGTPNLFTAVLDGTVEKARRPFQVPFGFAGLTFVDRGRPIPCRLIIAELARLRCQFSLLRRCFHRDLAGVSLADEIPKLTQACEEARQRSEQEVASDHRELVQVIQAQPCSLAVR